MSYAPARSENGSLRDGMTDGTYKKLNPNRGGFVETTTQESRAMLNPDTFGYQESPFQPMPDGTVRTAVGDVYYRSQTNHQG